MEIIKLNWSGVWPIVHSCSNSAYEPYIEDVLVRREPLKLVPGACDLMASSMQAAIDNFGVDYVVHLEADTWIFDQRVLERFVQQLDSKPEAVIATSSWSIDRSETWKQSRHLDQKFRYVASRVLRRMGIPYGIRFRNSLSLQFFVARATPEMVDLIANLDAQPGRHPEEKFYTAILERFGPSSIIGMPEREPVHPRYRDVCDALTLYSQHWPSAATAVRAPDKAGKAASLVLPGKQESLRAAGFANVGEHMRRLLESTDLGYYNGNAARNYGTDRI